MALDLPPKIIGIAGTNGSGKDTVGNLLAAEYGFKFISVTDLLRQELKLRGLTTAREHMRNLSAEWRRAYGLGVLIEKAIALYEQENSQYNGLAMASLRNPGEVDSVHQYGGVVLWVDAKAKNRYDRLQANAQLRGDERSVDDKKSFEEFMRDEEAEMHHPAGSDAATLSMQDVKTKSDLFIGNDGQDLNALSDKLKLLLKLP